MHAKLAEIRTLFIQGGDKGVSVEKVFREFFRRYLPRRLEFGAGEIIDIQERRSSQTDIIIVTEDHPLTFDRDTPGLFFIEGVCAAGEVKTILTSDELDKTLNNSYSFKQLEISEGLGAPLSINPSDLNRYYKHPPYFLVAFNSQLKLSTILEKIKGFLQEKSLDENEINKVLDAVFILDQGWIINFGDGQGCFQFVTAESTVASGWISIPNNPVLFDLLAWLSSVIPRVSLQEPILPRYMVQRKIS
jgi:hypothetical protein